MEQKNPLFDTFQQIKDYLKKSEELEIDCYDDIAPPLSCEEIEEWERKNNVKLPEGYKNWLLLANGLNAKWCGVISSIEEIKELDIPGYEGYYRIGGRTAGMLLIDKNGNCYEDDEDFGRERIEFEKFLEDYVIYYLKDQIAANS